MYILVHTFTDWLNYRHVLPVCCLVCRFHIKLAINFSHNVIHIDRLVAKTIKTSSSKPEVNFF